MRRALSLVVAVLAATIVGAVGWSAPAVDGAGQPRITRLFMPAIKSQCRAEAAVPDTTRIGYRFTRDGALVSIDRTGAFTGLEPAQLERLNACLAQYPIERLDAVPRDHYRRNLLYDYYAGVLQPCLARRVDGLPPLPSRADFIVRLFQWDPYRSIAPGRSLDELLALVTACPALPPYLARLQDEPEALTRGTVLPRYLAAG